MEPAISITIDGVVLNDTFYISLVDRQWPSVTTDKVTVPGRAGEVVTGQQIGSRTVSFRLWYPSSDHHEMYEAFAALVAQLQDGGEHTLTLSDEGGRTRRVKLDGDLTYQEYEGTASMDVVLFQEDPRCYGESKAVSIPKSTTVSFTTDYDACDIIIRASGAVKRDPDGVWGVLIDNEWTLHVKMGDSYDATSVSIDCARHGAYVDGDTAMLTTDSDWPVLKAGSHTIEIDAASRTTSDAIIEITERPL